MEYVIAPNGIFSGRVYAGVNVVWDATHFQAPETLTAAEAEMFGVHPLVETPQPPYDPATQVVTEIDPIPIDGVWTQQWVVSDIQFLPIEQE